MKPTQITALAAFTSVASAHFNLDYPAARGFDEDNRTSILLTLSKLTSSSKLATSPAAAKTPSPPTALYSPSPAAKSP
jgi:hypothetical protein